MKRFIWLTATGITLLFSPNVFGNDNEIKESIMELNDTLKSQTSDSLDNSYSENKFGFNFKIGRKFPETQKYGLKIDGGFWYGIGLNIKMSKYFSMQPEINIWNSNESAKEFYYSLSIIELTDFICFDGLLNNYHVRLYLGIGLAAAKKKSSKENLAGESLVTINAGVSYIIKIKNNLSLDFHLRHQNAGSSNLAGGSGYQSWLLGIIAEIYL